jgi:hypothetical protein
MPIAWRLALRTCQAVSRSRTIWVIWPSLDRTT